MSLLDGEADPEDLVLRAKEMGQKALACTNHGSMASIPAFYKSCMDNGIKPIIGCEFYVTEDINLKDAEHRSSYHLILLAKSNLGYRNMNTLLSKANLDGFYYKPRIDNNLLEQYSDGIICLSACRGGEIPQLILQGRYERAVTLALHYNEIFENFFLELQYDGDPDQEKVNEGLIAIHRETGIPLVVTADTHYAKEDDYYSHEVLLAIQTKKTMDDPDRFSFPINSYWLKSEAEIRQWNPPEEAISNTKLIADMCNVTIEFGKPKLPKFPVPLGFTSALYLQKLCEDSFYDMLAEGRIPDPFLYMERLNFELDVINPKGLSDYFLIVWDLLRYGRENGAIFGPGRGSAAGSLVSYLLKITRLDPIEHELLFERFLDPSRKELPDVDIDINPQSRPMIMKYLEDKYHNICHVGAYTTMAARGVIKDVGRALGISFDVTNEITKHVPQEQGQVWSIERCLKEIPEMQKYAEEYPELFKVAQQLEDIPRSASVHAAGVVISDEPLTNFMSLRRGEDGYPVSELNMEWIEPVGGVKIDLLAVNVLDIMADTLKFANKTGFDVYGIPLNDKNVLKFMTSGDLDGIFQCSSTGMRGIFKSINPDYMDFDTITAIISLYRPGPMQFIDTFISRKNGFSFPEYTIPELQPILQGTYGIIIYQEQCMRISTDLAGYSKADSSKFRKVIAKKKRDLVDPELHKLVYGLDEANIPGMVKNGINEDKAVELAEQIRAFAAYAFNRSHAACYALIAYVTAYLKYYHTVEFMTALMSNEKEAEEIIVFAQNCRDKGIKVLPPDINKSTPGFSIEGKAIRFGLNAIKGLGEAVVLELLLKRPFNCIEALLDSVPKKILNKSRVESLLHAGALDSIAPPNVNGDKMSRNELAVYINTLRGLKKNGLEPFDEFAAEKDVLGMYLSHHPLEGIANPIDWSRIYKNQTFTVIGMISDIKPTMTKKKEAMAFITIETLEGIQRFVAFPKIYRAMKWEKNMIVKIMAKKDDKSHIIDKAEKYTPKVI